MTLQDRYDRCNCEHPRCIVNPALIDMRGVEHVVWNYHIDKQPYSYDGVDTFSRFLRVIKPDDDIDGYGVLRHDGDFVPAFLVVRCNRCDLCLNSKRVSLAQKCVFQASENGWPVWFVTLTYNDDHFPPSANQLYKDLQKFRRRMVVYSKRYYALDNLKFVFFTELGGITRRPHIHLLLFDWHMKAPSGYSVAQHLKCLLMYCWRAPGSPKIEYNSYYADHKDDQLFRFWYRKPDYCLGEVQFKMCNNTSGAVMYVSKYMSKGAGTSSRRLSSGERPWEFRSVSYNLGLNFVRRHRDYMLKAQRPAFLQSEALEGAGLQVKTRYISSYYIDKLFPSFCRLVPAKVRRSVDNYMADYYYFKRLIHDVPDIMSQIPRIARHLDFIHGYFESLGLFELFPIKYVEDCRSPLQMRTQYYYEHVRELCDYIAKSPPIKDIKRLCIERDKVLQYYTMDDSPVRKSQILSQIRHSKPVVLLK